MCRLRCTDPQDKEFKNSKRRIGTDSFKECTAGGKTHYYLYLQYLLLYALSVVKQTTKKKLRRKELCHKIYEFVYNMNNVILKIVSI